MITRPLPTALLALALVSAAHVAAQGMTPEVADMTKLFKQELKTLKQTVAGATKALDTQLDVFALNFGVLASGDGPVVNLVGALADYQLAVEVAQGDLELSFAIQAQNVLAAVLPGGPDAGVVPKGLVWGDGGLMDDTFAAAKAIVTKANDAVNRKLVKLAAKLRKKTDLRLSAWLRPIPPSVIAPAFMNFDWGPTESLTIDLVVALNRGSIGHDGRLWIGGRRDLAADPVQIYLGGAQHLGLGVPTNDPYSPRWMRITDPVSESLAEGNYVITVFQGNGSTVMAAIGMP